MQINVVTCDLKHNNFSILIRKLDRLLVQFSISSESFTFSDNKKHYEESMKSFVYTT